VSDHYLAVAVNFFLSVLYSFATTASYGSSGSGAHNKAYSDNKAVLIDNAGLHSFFNISKQIAPV